MQFVLISIMWRFTDMMIKGKDEEIKRLVAEKNRLYDQVFEGRKSSLSPGKTKEKSLGSKAQREQKELPRPDEE